MRNLLTYILWPMLAGCFFAVSLISLPLLVTHYPGLFPFLSPTNTQSQIMTSFTEPVRKAAPAVVSINSKQQVVRPVEIYDQNYPHLQFYTRIQEDDNTLGSGVIISPDGYIITSFHLLFRPGLPTFPEESIITLHDGRNIEARVVALDEENDLALLKVDEENLPHISIGPSRNLEVGELVLAIGNPRNIGQSVSLGIISALLRRNDEFVIQTDAAINPGNSGGALIDAQGNLIGINSTIVSESGGSEGIGFATPADRAVQLMEDYIASDPSGYLGVETNELTMLEMENHTIGGFRIERVTPNSPADKAGIRRGDILTHANGMPVDYETSGIHFILALADHEPGEAVTIGLYRGREFIEVEATLAVGEWSVTPLSSEERQRRQQETGQGRVEREPSPLLPPTRQN